MNQPIDLRSDNVSGAHETILQALLEAGRGSSASYGEDEWSERLSARFSALFEREVSVFPVATGTAANALALSLYLPPWGACFCHPHAHIQVDECNAPELFSGGAKLIAVDGANGKLDPEALAAAIRGEGFVHSPQPSLLSISQASELGSVYTLAELAELSAFAKRHRLALHMDGARFANAICALGVSPADLSWRAGVDVLSFGATKNGCLAAEAIVLFDRARASELGFRRKRAGHLLSKLRFLSAQLEAYLLDDLWLSNARHANAMAARLGAGLSALGLPPLAAVEANEIFVAIPESTAQRLRAAQCLFYDWPDLGPAVRRLVTSFETTLEAVDAFIAAVSGSG